MLEAEGATPSIVKRSWWLGPNPSLCYVCRLAEAAHEETTVGR